MRMTILGILADNFKIQKSDTSIFKVSAKCPSLMILRLEICCRGYSKYGIPCSNFRVNIDPAVAY